MLSPELSGTIKNIVVTPKGANVDDYSDIKVTKGECQSDHDLAEQQCRNKMTARAIANIVAYALPGVAGVGIDVVGAITTKAASVAASSVFAIDGIVNFMVTAGRIVQIGNAAAAAADQNCDCCKVLNPPRPRPLA